MCNVYHDKAKARLNIVPVFMYFYILLKKTDWFERYKNILYPGILYTPTHV